ncbi:MAG TPA: PQ-loop domain-containing transporter [Candidatus Saccharimonadales bacterium]|nr:PQ-loop domain-containing transporter [Candidatus Saccharimonadales bacterium]
MAKDKHRQKHLPEKGKYDVMDILVYFFTFATPLFEVPQLIEIYANHSAEDVSIWTWAFFCVDNIVWIVYAARRRLIPVLITSVLYELFEISILVGIILYQ